MSFRFCFRRKGNSAQELLPLACPQVHVRTMPSSLHASLCREYAAVCTRPLRVTRRHVACRMKTPRMSAYDSRERHKASQRREARLQHGKVLFILQLHLW